MKAPALLLALALLAAPAFAQDGISVGQPWARATIGQTTSGAAYLTLDTAGAEPDHLVGVETPVAERADLHGHTMEGDVMKMRPVERIEVAPGSPTVLQPGGLHIMLFGLKAPLREGETFPATLIFEKAGRIEIEVRVQGIAASGPGS
jgi:copper(I)-binding protein